MRAANLVDGLARHVATAQHTRRTLCAHDIEAQIAQDTRDREDMALVTIAHRDKDFSLTWIGHVVVDSELRLGIRLGIALGDTHHLARRLHLGPQDNLGSREATPRHNRFLHAEPIQATTIARQMKVGDLLPRHDACGALGKRHTSGLGDKGCGWHEGWPRSRRSSRP